MPSLVHRGSQPQPQPRQPDSPENGPDGALFVDPMLGVPLQIYIELDVPERDALVALVKDNGGIIASGYSSVPYILVDPAKDSGQALYLQYAGKKGKVVLDAKWVYKCVDAGRLQTYQSNFASCKVNGSERAVEQRDAEHTSPTVPQPQPPLPPIHIPSSHEPSTLHRLAPARTHQDALQHALVPLPTQQSGSSSSLIHSTPLIFNHHDRTTMPDPHSPASNWNASVRSLPYPPNPPVNHWGETFDQGSSQPTQSYDFAYRAEEQWPAPSAEFFPQQFQPNVPFQPNSFGPASVNAIASGSNDLPPDRQSRPKTRPKAVQSPKIKGKHPRLMGANASPERSPTPPRRVLKSIHGGNNFTDDDVQYLERYIDYCRKQGLPLSLREICERLAIKAPHHTFYSWRRYCNKHQIRLGGYEMEEPSPSERSETPHLDGADHDPRQPDVSMAQLPEQISSGGAHMVLGEVGMPTGGSRNRSPSPPRMLFRSTTGKGVAFTTADVSFLVRYLEYYRAKDANVNMVQFWKRIAEKAPHHSRASWMKYWRRHKHELEGVSPAVPRPEKKKKYDFKDDLLLAKYFVQKPVGTSDSIFQAFARDYPHHPWKGWQEHHRIHKAKIDHIIQQIETGELQIPDQIP